MHRLPKNRDRGNEWLRALGNFYGDKRLLPMSKMWRRYICGLHFQSPCYTEGKTLKRTSIPTTSRKSIRHGHNRDYSHAEYECSKKDGFSAEQEYFNDDCINESCFRSKWFTNPYVRGAYSHTTVRCNAGHILPSNLLKPVECDGKPVILLAGEACHDTHFSTTHGAFEAGESQAKYLVNYLNRPSC